VSPDWYDQSPDPSPYQLESHFDDFGNLKPDLHHLTEDHTEPISRSEVKAFATHLIRDSLVSARSSYVSTRAQRKQ